MEIKKGMIVVGDVNTAEMVGVCVRGRGWGWEEGNTCRCLMFLGDIGVGFTGDRESVGMYATNGFFRE